MPVRKTSKDGKPAYQWGESGTKYTYTAGDDASRMIAKGKAERQGRAVHASGYKG